MVYYFAWVSEQETAFAPEHKREDEHVFSFSFSHDEGDFAALELVIENPRVGLLAPSRPRWAWFAVDDTPLFFGRLIGVPDDIGGECVRLSFIARPADYEDQRAAVAEAKAREWPYYDRIWFSPDDLDNPDNVLEARPELWFIDPVTHQVTASHIAQGEGAVIVFDESQVLYDSVSVSYGATPYRRVDVEATVSWDQAATGSVDLTMLVSPISTYTGDGLISSWPKPGATLGGGWVVTYSDCRYLTANNVPVWEWRKPDGRWKFKLNNTWCLKVPNAEADPALPTNSQIPEQILALPMQVVHGGLAVGYDVSRRKSETVRFSLVADTQAIITDPGDDAVLSLSFSSSELVSPIDPGGAMPIGKPCRRAYFSQDRGAQSLEYLIALARARLIASARCVDVSFVVPMQDALDAAVTLQRSARVIDRRLPGGVAEGKVKRIAISGDGDNGDSGCEITIGCSIGYGGNVDATPGQPSYVAAGYVADGWQRAEGAHVVPPNAGVWYTPVDGVEPNDDGLDFERLALNHVLKEFRRGGLYAEQEAAMGKVADDPKDVFERLNRVPTTIDVRLRPVTGGPFHTDYLVGTSPLVIAKTIDLEAESAP